MRKQRITPTHTASTVLFYKLKITNLPNSISREFRFFNPGMENAEFNQKMADKGANTARPFPLRPIWARVTMGTTEGMQQFASVLP